MTDHAHVAHHIVRHCGSLAAGEAALIVSDPSTADIGALLAEAATATTGLLTHMSVPIADRHGAEPPAEVAAAMLTADLTISACRYSHAHSRARLAAADRGRRFLSLPGYTIDMLALPALIVDYQAQEPVVRGIANAFSAGSVVRVSSRAGTDVTVRIDGRIGNACPGFVNRAYLLGSPPDIEANVSPLEDSAEGTAVIDGSVTCPEIGLVEKPIVLEFASGKVSAVSGGTAAARAFLAHTFGEPNSKRRVLAECGIGLNPQAQLTGHMLTDEGALGCVHFGLGSNYTVGGKNKVDFHLDFVMRDALVWVDDRQVVPNGAHR